MVTGFPRVIESIKKVLNCKIDLQDFENVLNLAKMYIKYWKSMEFQNFAIFILIFVLAVDESFANFFFIVFHK